MVKEFNSLEEIKKYYDKKTNTYVFKENDEYIYIINFGFNLDIESNIDAWDIDADNIRARHISAQNIVADSINAEKISARNIDAFVIIAREISARNIDAFDIMAQNIIFEVTCIAEKDIKCASIVGQLEKSIYKSLNGDVIIGGKKQDCETKPSIADFKNGEFVCVPKREKIKILCVEDGSIDELAMQQIREGANLDGKTLVYRQGCKPPYILEI